MILHRMLLIRGGWWTDIIVPCYGMNRKELQQNKIHNDKDVTSIKKIDLSSFERKLHKAQACIDVGDLDAAKSLLTSATKIAPNSSEPFHMQALIFYSEGRIEDAGEKILEAITRDDTNPILHANCGAIMNLLGRPQEAEAACRHAIDLDPSNAEPHNNLAISLDVQGRLIESQEAAIIAIELDPQYLEACITLGNILMRVGEPLTAIDSYRAAIRIDPNAVLARANLAVALKEIGQKDLAEKERQKALEIDPIITKQIIND